MLSKMADGAMAVWAWASSAGLLGWVKQQICCFTIILSYINNSDLVKVKLIFFCEDDADSADFH